MRSQPEKRKSEQHPKVGAAIPSASVSARFAVNRPVVRQHRLERALARLYGSGGPTVTVSDVTAAAPAQAFPAKWPHRDLRSFPRRDSGCVVSVQRESGGVPVVLQHRDWLLDRSRPNGPLVDVGMNGVAFESSTPFEEGERLYLKFVHRQVDHRFAAQGSVLRCQARGGGVWRVVCQFDRNLTFEQAHLLGRHLARSSIV